MRPHYDIVEVKEVLGYEKVNGYLQNGWVLISAHNSGGEAGGGGRDPPPLPLLGRPKKRDCEE